MIIRCLNQRIESFIHKNKISTDHQRKEKHHPRLGGVFFGDPEYKKIEYINYYSVKPSMREIK